MDIVCRDCGAAFFFSRQQDAFYRDKGLHRPSRCPDCRRLSKVFTFENLNMAIRQSPIEVVCPRCGVIYYKDLELPYRSLEYAWMVGGYHVITCDDCRSEKVSVAADVMRKALEPRKIGGWTFT